MVDVRTTVVVAGGKGVLPGPSFRSRRTRSGTEHCRVPVMTAKVENAEDVREPCGRIAVRFARVGAARKQQWS